MAPESERSSRMGQKSGRRTAASLPSILAAAGVSLTLLGQCHSATSAALHTVFVGRTSDSAARSLVGASRGSPRGLSLRGRVVVHEREPGKGEVKSPAPSSAGSFDDSPEWVKLIVGGLTAVVNSFSGGDATSQNKEPRVRSHATISPDVLFEGLRSDFEDRQYLWTGDIDAELYAEDCTFTDPTLSFQGLETFETNLRNLRPILDSVVPAKRRECILRDLVRDDTTGKVTAKWTMIGNLSLPWQPTLMLGGTTTYTPGVDGRIVSYDETWDITAADALAQLLQPGSAVDNAPADVAEHWPGRLEGAPPPEPRAKLDGQEKAPIFVLLPGFGNDAIDYDEPLGQDPIVGLKACMQRRGCKLEVSEVSRPDWLLVFFYGLLDEDFRAGNGQAKVAFGWYLDRAKKLVETAVQKSGEPVVVVGHSAGGWLARALMQREGLAWVEANIHGVVTLGSPHFPPPPGRMDMTQGCLRNLNEAHPGAYYSDSIFYVTVAGDAVVGEKIEGNLPIIELIQSPSPESTAWNSYNAVCGTGNVTGDGVVPLQSSHLAGARQLTLQNCLHSINIAGTTRPTDKSYLCEGQVDDWLELALEALASKRQR